LIFRLIERRPGVHVVFRVDHRINKPVKVGDNYQGPQQRIYSTKIIVLEIVLSFWKSTEKPQDYSQCMDKS
jgi:hypothetical protein